MWLLAAVSCSIAAGLSTILILRNSEWYATNNIKAAEANLLSLGILDLIANSTDIELDPLIPKTVDSAQLSEIVRLYDSRGNLIYSNINIRDLSTNIRQQSRFIDRGIFVMEGSSREYFTLIRSYRAPTGRVFLLQIAAPRPIGYQVLRENVIPFSLVFIALLLFSFFVARWVAVQGLSPLRKIMRQIDALDFDRLKSWQPLGLNEVPSDFRPLVEKINELVLRSQKSLLKFHQLGRFIAHEVRTPLTIIQGEIETGLMGDMKDSDRTKNLLESALQEVSRIDQIVQTVLRLASKDRAKDPYKPEVFDLRDFLKQHWEELEKLAHRDLKLNASGAASESYEVLMDPELLSLLLSNLARNIHKHTSSNVKAEISLLRNPDRSLTLMMDDSGAGMSPELVEELNDPQAVSRKAGLGLSLCKEIVSVSKLNLSFENRPSGGLRTKVNFPALLQSQLKN